MVFVYEVTATSCAGARLLLFVCVPPAHPARVFWASGSAGFSSSADGNVVFNGRQQAKWCFPFAVSGLEVPWVQSLSVSRRHECATRVRNTAQDVSDC